MANQCEQLLRLWRVEGVTVELVQTNAPYRPAWVGGVPVLRAGFRLMPYLARLWRAFGRAEVVHVLANSGWSWHLVAAPALWLARWRGVAAVVNYRGGEADAFFSAAPRHVLRALARAELRVVPSTYLLRVFARQELDAEVVPNIVDLSRFAPAVSGGLREFGNAPHLLVSRNLEPIYDLPTALHAFALLRQTLPGARLTLAGSGPEEPALRRLAGELGLADAVVFTGRIENARMPALLAQADLLLNPSTVDNMPISILEAFASGVPVVSTRAGGIPDLVADGVDGLLVPVGDPAAMAAAALRVLTDPALAARLRAAGLDAAQQYAWPQVRGQWLSVYRRAAALRSKP